MIRRTGASKWARCLSASSANGPGDVNRLSLWPDATGYLWTKIDLLGIDAALVESIGESRLFVWPHTRSKTKKAYIVDTSSSAMKVDKTFDTTSSTWEATLHHYLGQNDEDP